MEIIHLVNNGFSFEKLTVTNILNIQDANLVTASLNFIDIILLKLRMRRITILLLLN